MNEVKVLHFIPGFRYGGIETTTLNIYKNLTNPIISIEILVESQNKSDLLDELKKIGCKVHTIEKMNKYHLVKYIKQILVFFHDNGPYHIVHSYNIVRTPIIFFIAMFFGVKNRIYHARTNLSSPIFYERFILRIFIFLGTLLATELLACSDKAVKYFFGNRSATVIKNGIDTNKYLYNPEIRLKLRAELGLENCFVIGHIGRFCEAKNHSFIIDIFLETIEKIPNAKLILIGDGPNKNMIEEKIKTVNIEDRVILTGAISNVNEYLQAMDIFIFPSLYEGFGNVAVEAQAAGLRVIASDRVPYSVKLTNLVEFLSLETPEEWVNLLFKYKDLSYRKEMKNEISESGYDIETNVYELERLYEELATKQKV